MEVTEYPFSYLINRNEEKTYLEFEYKMLSLWDNNHFQNCFKPGRFVYNGNTIENQDDELKMVVERNKELRSQIDKNLQEITQKQRQYEVYKKDQKHLAEEIKDTHDSYLTTKKYFKKMLKIYYTIESRRDNKQIIFVQFFTEAKKDSENYSVRLERNTFTGEYQVLSTTPKLSCTKDLQIRPKETEDIPGTLCVIRQAFLNIKANKK